MREWALTKRHLTICRVVGNIRLAARRHELAKRLSMSAPNPYQPKKTGRPRPGK